MKKIIILAAIFIFLFETSTFAHTTIEAAIDKTSLTTDDVLTYKITITSCEKKLPKLSLPKFEGFNVISQTQSSSISFVENGIKTILVYAFTLVPYGIGQFKIGPCTINIKNKIYSTRAFDITVTQGKAKSKIPSKEKPVLPKRIQPEPEQPQITL